MSAIFTAQGQWKETEKIISVSQLPDAIMQYVHQHYGNKTPQQPAKLWKPGGKMLYELEIKGVNRELVFTPNGKLINKNG
jgi:hypothetical protein